MKEDEYKTLKGSSEGVFKDRGSRFIAKACPVENVEEVKEILLSLRKEYHDARHHCYAYIIGTDEENWRANDDGEPSGSAGNPILGQIRSFGLTNVLIVVIRYFGGTLLGVGGLINAYRNAARAAIESNSIITKTVKVRYQLKFPYLSLNSVMKLLKDEGLTQENQEFDNECMIIVSFRHSIETKVTERLGMIDDLSYTRIDGE